jgi:hypothetical protein
MNGTTSFWYFEEMFSDRMNRISGIKKSFLLEFVWIF